MCNCSEFKKHILVVLQPWEVAVGAKEGRWTQKPGVDKARESKLGNRMISLQIISMEGMALRARLWSQSFPLDNLLLSCQ
jgi:hypothetical protein